MNQNSLFAPLAKEIQNAEARVDGFELALRKARGKVGAAKAINAINGRCDFKMSNGQIETVELY